MGKMKIVVEVDPADHLGRSLTAAELASVTSVAQRQAEVAVQTTLLNMATGDRPGPNPNPNVDTSTDPKVEVQGDDPTAPPASPMVKPQSSAVPTAGELRAMGYVVPDRFADEEIPTEYLASTIGPPGMPPRLVDSPTVTLAPVPEPAEPEKRESKSAPSVEVSGGQELPSAKTEMPVNATPAASARAVELGVDLRQITGSGKDGQTTKADVETYAEAIKDRPT